VDVSVPFDEEDESPFVGMLKVEVGSTDDTARTASGAWGVAA
jgi:hypothetical protein